MSDFGKAVEQVIKRRQAAPFKAKAMTSGERYIKAKVVGAHGTILVKVPKNMEIMSGNDLLVTEYEKNKFSILSDL